MRARGRQGSCQEVNAKVCYNTFLTRPFHVPAAFVVLLSNKGIPGKTACQLKSLVSQNCCGSARANGKKLEPPIRRFFGACCSMSDSERLNDVKVRKKHDRVDGMSGC